MTRETASRWNTHEVIGAKPKQEFLGPDLDSMSFSMTLSAWRGVSPLQMAQRLREFCSNGEVDNLIIGGQNFGEYLIESVSETYNVVNNRGEIVQASVDVSLKEYV
nr:MAG TPA: hypothetical protein [Caudoviricetes sp.]